MATNLVWAWYNASQPGLRGRGTGTRSIFHFQNRSDTNPHPSIHTSCKICATWQPNPATKETVRTHGIANGIEEWRSDGWLGSDIAGYQSDLLNATTAVFKVKWRDRYADGNEEFECGWYMADLKSNGWVISQYADIDCAEHDL